MTKIHPEHKPSHYAAVAAGHTSPRRPTLQRQVFQRWRFVAASTLTDAADDGLWCVAWSSAGHIVAGSCDETVRSFQLSGDAPPAIERRHELHGHSLSINSVAVSADASLAASSGLDSHIRLWNLEHGEELLDINAGPIEAWSVSLAGNGRFLASGTHRGHVNLWSVKEALRGAGAASDPPMDTIPTGASAFVFSVAFSPDGKQVACGTAEGAVYVLDVETKKMLHRLDGHSSNVRTLAFSADGARLTTGSDDGHVNMYEVSTALQVASMAGHTSWVLGVACAPNGGVVASCSADKSVRLWDVGTRQPLQELANAHSEHAWGVAFDPTNANRLASVGDDKAITLYEATGS